MKMKQASIGLFLLVTFLLCLCNVPPTFAENVEASRTCENSAEECRREKMQSQESRRRHHEGNLVSMAVNFAVDAANDLLDVAKEKLFEWNVLKAQPETKSKGHEDGEVEVEVDEAEAELRLKEETQLQVLFTNLSPMRVSLQWRGNGDEYQMVVLTMLPGASTKIKTWEGHRFTFTREGTIDGLGEDVVIQAGRPEYNLPADVKPRGPGDCIDRLPRTCLSLAEDGECIKNPGWMIVNCPKSCSACELLNPNIRCDFDRLNTTRENVWKPGDLNKMFNRIVEDDSLSTTILSQPPNPWVVQFDDFLSDEEVAALVRHGTEIGFQRSTDQGEMNAVGEKTKVYSESRTSTNAWCDVNCANDPPVRGITDRIESTTEVPSSHYESFQVLQYEIGQEYKPHHDMDPGSVRKVGGHRILTFFLYLSDVEQGGGTDFPKLRITVKPRKGRAVLWPHVLDEDPYVQDPRTLHAALPVGKGMKYAANHWIHSHDYEIGNKWGCTGSFS